MRVLTFAVLGVIFTTAAVAEIQTKTIEYRSGELVLEGYMAWDDAQDVQKPAVIVIHEWWGNDDYSRRRARELAELGYVGFAIDMYGKGKTTQDPKQAAEWATAVRKDPDLAHALLADALQTLKDQPQVDANRIAAIGYCFGGTMVLNMARWGMDVDGVVAFHADLSNPHPTRNRKIAAKILVAHGSDDGFVPDAQVDALRREMQDANADHEIKVYPGAQHSFTNPDADKHGIQYVKYNEPADRKSWNDMKAFLAEVFSG